MTLEYVNCGISENLGYTVFSTAGAFYLPLAFIVAVYLNVWVLIGARNYFTPLKRDQ